MKSGSKFFTLHSSLFTCAYGRRSPHSANRSNEPPQSVRIYSRACSTMSANVSVSLLPSAYTNVTFSSPIEHMAVTVCPDATAFR